MPRHPTTASHRLTDREAGFSVVEVIIAMMVLALISIGLMPLMMSAINGSATNRSIVRATSLATAQLATMRQRLGAAPTSTCTQITAIATELSIVQSGLKETMVSSSCPAPADRPETVTVTVTVTPTTNETQVLARLSTEILVS